MFSGRVILTDFRGVGLQVIIICGGSELEVDERLKFC
jgi:hypothetical protein